MKGLFKFLSALCFVIGIFGGVILFFAYDDSQNNHTDIILFDFLVGVLMLAIGLIFGIIFKNIYQSIEKRKQRKIQQEQQQMFQQQSNNNQNK